MNEYRWGSPSTTTLDGDPPSITYSCDSTFYTNAQPEKTENDYRIDNDLILENNCELAQRARAGLLPVNVWSPKTKRFTLRSAPRWRAGRWKAKT